MGHSKQFRMKKHVIDTNQNMFLLNNKKKCI